MIRLSVGFMLGLALLTAPALASDAKLKKATGLYKLFCAHCHGLNMVNPGTSSFDLRKWSKDKKDEFYTVVRKGKRNMPAWGDVVTPEELDLLWFYVVTRAGKEPFPEAAAKPAPASEPVTTMEPGKLTACVARNGGVMSGARHNGGTGLDYGVVEALAKALNLKLKVTWFESEQEEESDPVKETYAMLSHGLCDLVPGFALYASALSGVEGQRGALPRWDDQPDHLPLGFQVDLKPVKASVPYARMEMGIVVSGSSVPAFKSLADLEGRKVGVEQGTLAGVLTLRQGTKAMVAEARTFNPGPAFLWKMENGEFDAALVTVAAFDFHKRQNPISKLKLSDYRHPLGFNLGIALLKNNAPLAKRVDEALTAMLSSGEVRKISEGYKMHYAEPKVPHIQARLTLKDILTIR
ncbi:MAG: transporter substrate-binding domain-containing protein [Rhizobiales bacterium]|nr:transporter substrate-binding domain-containing protein [Hyphomicrobiales bacterium]